MGGHIIKVPLISQLESCCFCTLELKYSLPTVPSSVPEPQWVYSGDAVELPKDETSHILGFIGNVGPLGIMKFCFSAWVLEAHDYKCSTHCLPHHLLPNWRQHNETMGSRSSFRINGARYGTCRSVKSGLVMVGRGVCLCMCVLECAWAWLICTKKMDTIKTELPRG